jgi:hypothetical protein
MLNPFEKLVSGSSKAWISYLSCNAVEFWRSINTKF